MNPALSRPLNARTRHPVQLTYMGFGAVPLGNLYKKIADADAQAILEVAYYAQAKG